MFQNIFDIKNDHKMNIRSFFLLLLSFHGGIASIWEDFSIDGVHEDTGYSSDVIDYLYRKYYHDIFPSPSTRFPDLPYDATYEEMSFYLGFVYIHLYPRFCHFGRVMRVRLANEPLLCCTANT
uniref:Uncharacterized protein n=1 Tax=Octactis speculum TaxID=3111310 RepID=A0A7S2AKM1_9STRA|mmetsp:Transcript_1155/g.1406  ORF Transcript_1155/g.1406 Transcript_1155/m.1406 type:complete len:123 (+) Transcript_1155:279-647(+)